MHWGKMKKSWSHKFSSKLSLTCPINIGCCFLIAIPMSPSCSWKFNSCFVKTYDLFVKGTLCVKIPTWKRLLFWGYCVIAHFKFSRPIIIWFFISTYLIHLTFSLYFMFVLNFVILYIFEFLIIIEARRNDHNLPTWSHIYIHTHVRQTTIEH